MSRRSSASELPPEARAILKRPPHVTYALMGVLVLAYALQRRLGGVESPLDDIRLGANVSGMVFEGDWWRLVTGNFLHGPYFHLAANLWGLWVLGAVLERLLDGRRLLLLYMVSALAGAGASAAFGTALMGVGASTAVFGLLGGFAVLHFKPGLGLPPMFRQTTRWWVIILGINAFISFGVPIVDGPAHVGGFVGGAVVAWALAGPSRPLTQVARDPLVLGATIAMLAVFGFGLGQLVLVQSGGFFEGSQGARLGRALAATESAESANELAWRLAIDERSGPAAIQAAVAGALRATELAPDESAFLDTGYAQHRAGDRPAAVAAELRALLQVDRGQSFYAVQLCRFAAHDEATPTGHLEVRPAGQRVVAADVAPGLLVARVRQGAVELGCWVGRVGGSAATLVRDRRAVALPDGVTLEPLWHTPTPQIELAEGRWLWWRAAPNAESIPYEVIGRSAEPVATGD